MENQSLQDRVLLLEAQVKAFGGSVDKRGGAPVDPPPGESRGQQSVSVMGFTKTGSKESPEPAKPVQAAKQRTFSSEDEQEPEEETEESDVNDEVSQNPDAAESVLSDESGEKGQ